MGRLEELEAENERLLANRRTEDLAKWQSLFSATTRIETACAGCRAIREEDSTKLRDLDRVVNGKDSYQGLKGVVATLSTRMGLIQWVVGAVVVAVLTAAADRIINRPATCEGLEATAKEAVRDAVEKSAIKAASVLLEAQKKGT